MGMPGTGADRHWTRMRRSLPAILLAGLALVVAQVPARALPAAGVTTAVADVTAPVTGNATWFTNLGAPYGGCGLPQDGLETQNWLALNVFDTPGDYTFYPRPLTGANASKIGMWDNGRNCGRWVRVTISDYCSGGVNDGARNQAFCRGGQWVADKYNGATLDMLVADSCGDDNGWCRDDPYHLDLAKDSINTFVKDGVPVGDLEPGHWGNRHVSWNFIPAPDYTGDIEIGFVKGAQRWWGAISVNHLQNGIHGLEYFSGGSWSAGEMITDMGQAFVIKPLTEGGTDYRIRVRDVTDTLINGGREYSFSMPAACGSECTAPRTLTTYTTGGGSPATPAVTTPAVTTPVATTPAVIVDPPPPSTTAAVTPAATTPAAATGCSAALRTVSSWAGGFQAEVTVTAASAITGWTVRWTPPAGQSISSVWNGASGVSGGSVTVRNADYNGALGAGRSTSFGFLATGTAGTPTLSCAAT